MPLLNNSARTTISLQQTNVRELILETKVGFVGFEFSIGSCDGFLGMLTPLSLFLDNPVTGKTHKQIQLDQAVETWIEI